ncbi:MAG: PepSY domain-containing protein [Pseudomonadales bacterium]
MPIAKIHKIIGLIICIPILLWATTGMVFLIKPGYSEAYQSLEIRRYPLSHSPLISAGQQWENINYFKSILGDHLIVQLGDTVRHLDPVSLENMPQPGKAQIAMLIEDAIRTQPERYGSITEISGSHIKTSTGVDIELKWGSMVLRQKGSDTEFINLLYRLHYLQWTSHAEANRYLATLAIILLSSLSIFGFFLAFKQRSQP